MPPPLMTRLGLWLPHHFSCTDSNNVEVTDWLGIKIRKINVRVPSLNLGGEVFNLRGKQLGN